MKRWLALGGLLAVLAAGSTFATRAADDKADPDWPTFRGANRDDHSPDKGLLKEWPAEGPPLAWKEAATGLGSGYSGVSVVGDKIFSMGDKGDSCYVVAVDRGNGKFLWETKVGKAGAPGGYAGPRCTPTVNNGLVYAVGQGGDLVCLDAAKGTEMWRKDFKKDYKGGCGAWGFSESPLVDGDTLIVTPGGKDATVLALDKKTGAEIWKGVVPNGDSAAYSSIVIADIGGVKQYVTLLANGVVGFSAKEGKLLWRYGDAKDRFGGNTANIPTCIVEKDHIFCCAGYGRGGALIKVIPEAQGTFKVEEVYFNKELNNKHGGVVLVDKHVYGSRDDRASLYCADLMTGKIPDEWGQKKATTKGNGSVAISFADGNLYLRYQNGIVALAEATPTGYKEKSSFKIPDTKGPSWPHPVIVGGKLYLREQDKLWCYDVKAK